jgi:hypothetical protein
VPVPQAAVRTVPDTLPNGLRYAPEVALDSGSLLVSTQTSPGVIDRLWVYDLRTRRASKVTDVPEPDGASEYAGGFAVGDGEVVWSVTDGPGDAAATEIWAAPLGGGTARKVVSMAASAKEGQVGSLVVADGRIRWSPEAFEDASVVEATGGSTGAVEPAVYEVPLAGGRPRMVPGTAGYLIMSWPWIGAPGSSGGKTGDVAFRTMRNLETGETRAVSVPNTWKCGISWCLGVAPTNVTLNRVPDLHVLPLAGGTGRTLVGDALAIDGPVLYDRFVNTVIRPGKHNALYDLSSGKVLDIGPNYRDSIPQSIPSARGDGSGVALDRYLIKETKGAFEIVDLAVAD